jgi:ribonuclease P protein component
MLKRTARLTSEQDYAAVYRRGRRLRARGFICVALATPTPTRLGVVVSKKVSTKATIRNRYKRWLWAAARELKATIPTRGYALVLTVSPSIARLTYSDVRTDLAQIIKVLPRKA